MSWIDQLEKKLGRFALPGLMRVIAGFQGLVFLLSMSMEGLSMRLFLFRAELLQGEVWRAVTFLIVPPGGGPLMVLFGCLFLVWMGDMVEAAWGAFKLNLYVLAIVVSAVLFTLVFNAVPMPGILSMSLIVLAAMVHPNMEILLFMVIPVKLKYLAILDVASIGFLFLKYGSLPGGAFYQLGIISQLIPMLVIVLPVFFKNMRDQSRVAVRRERFQAAKEPEGATFHRCHSCGTTEKSRPQAEFRVSAVDHEEYCDQCRPPAEPPSAAASAVDPPAPTNPSASPGKPWSSIPL